jgi:hypothetical protein
MIGISVQLNYSNATPSAKTFLSTKVTAATNNIEITAHGLLTGLKGQLTTDGTLPAGLDLLTDYFVIAVDVNNIKLAASLANAIAGTAIDITNTGGVGNTHTFTATTAGSNVFKLQASNDNSNFVDISGKTVTIATSTATSLFEISSPTYRYLKLLYTPSAGAILLSCYVDQINY